MRGFEEKLKRIIEEKGIEAEHLSFDQCCRSVAEAAGTAGAEPEDSVKSICMVEGGAIVAIVKGEDSASTSRVAKALGIEIPSRWIAEETTPSGLVGFSSRRYMCDEWSVKVSWPVVWKPTYQLEIEYTGEFTYSWEGTVDQSGNIEESDN